MSYARLVAKLERYEAYRNAPASGRGNAARAPRSHWQETYAGPSLDRPFPPLLFVFAPAPRRAALATREAAFHDRARRVGGVNREPHCLLFPGGWIGWLSAFPRLSADLSAYTCEDAIQ
ncbi:hypothetical protein [Streptomyces sp. NPDC056701]